MIVTFIYTIFKLCLWFKRHIRIFFYPKIWKAEVTNKISNLASNARFLIFETGTLKVNFKRHKIDFVPSSNSKLLKASFISLNLDCPSYTLKFKALAQIKGKQTKKPLILETYVCVKKNVKYTSYSMGHFKEYIHKKKILESRKFFTFCFWSFYTF